MLFIKINDHLQKLSKCTHLSMSCITQSCLKEKGFRAESLSDFAYWAVWIYFVLDGVAEDLNSKNTVLVHKMKD